MSDFHFMLFCDQITTLTQNLQTVIKKTKGAQSNSSLEAVIFSFFMILCVVRYHLICNVLSMFMTLCLFFFGVCVKQLTAALCP